MPDELCERVCLRCGYALFAGQAKCPECGHAIDDAALRDNVLAEARSAVRMVSRVLLSGSGLSPGWLWSVRRPADRSLATKATISANLVALAVVLASVVVGNTIESVTTVEYTLVVRLPDGTIVGSGPHETWSVTSTFSRRHTFDIVRHGVPKPEGGVTCRIELDVPSQEGIERPIDRLKTTQEKKEYRSCQIVLGAGAVGCLPYWMLWIVVSWAVPFAGLIVVARLSLARSRVDLFSITNGGLLFARWQIVVALAVLLMVGLDTIARHALQTTALPMPRSLQWCIWSLPVGLSCLGWARLLASDKTTRLLPRLYQRCFFLTVLVVLPSVGLLFAIMKAGT
jgi:lysylphosphatidylglycerol synthetase-like protein (DUF2156 family)